MIFPTSKPLHCARYTLYHNRKKHNRQNIKSAVLSIILALCVALTVFTGVVFAFADVSYAQEMSGKWTDSGNYDTSWYGDGTADSFRIETPAELAGLSRLVNAGFTFEGKTISLYGEFDLSAHAWVPIGNNGKYFSGTFNGRKAPITNMNITEVYSQKDVAVGFFGQLKNGVLKNISLSGNITATTTNVAVSGPTMITGGIVGIVDGDQNTLVENCSFSGAVAPKLTHGYFATTYTGGIAGSLNTGTIRNCYNEAAIIPSVSQTNIHIYAGGIVGRFGVGNGAPEIQNCFNSGKNDVTGFSSFTVLGGIAGVASVDGKLLNCMNSAYLRGSPVGVTGTDNAYGGMIGRIIGRYNGRNDILIRNCYTLTREICGDIVRPNDGITIETNSFPIDRKIQRDLDQVLSTLSYQAKQQGWYPWKIVEKNLNLNFPLGYPALDPVYTDPPIITTQPQDKDAIVGYDNEFTVEVDSNGEATYQWQKRVGDFGTWENVDDQNPPQNIHTVRPERVPAIQQKTYLRCIITNDMGDRYSNIASYWIKSRNPVLRLEVTPTLQGTTYPREMRLIAILEGGYQADGLEVSFYDHTQLGPPVLIKKVPIQDGSAILTFSDPELKEHIYSAKFGGDMNNNGTDSASVTYDLRNTIPPDSTIQFDANGGEGSMEDQTVRVTDNLKLAPNQFSAPAGTVFTGWNTDPGGTGTAYHDQGEYRFASDVLLYAQWVVHTHDWAADWSTDTVHHWHECNVTDCPTENNGKDGYAAHDYDDDSNADCNTCGYDRTQPPPEHTHDWAADWTTDAAHHWHECKTEPGCPISEGSGKDGYGAHDYDDDSDADCNTCGFVRTIVPVIYAPVITTHSLSDGKIGVAYHQQLVAEGTEPIAWGVVGGSLPKGLSLNGNLIDGTPTEAGTTLFTLQAENGTTPNDTKEYSITVLPKDIVQIAPISPVDPSKPIDTTKDLKIGFQGEYANLASISLNGKELILTEIDPTSCNLSGWPGYEKVLGKAESGSVYVTLYKEFLATLPNGSYVLEVSFEDATTVGAGSAQFTVQEAPATATPAPTADVASPATGDDTNIALWVGLLAIGLTSAGLAVYILIRRRYATKR